MPNLVGINWSGSRHKFLFGFSNTGYMQFEAFKKCIGRMSNMLDLHDNINCK